MEKKSNLGKGSIDKKNSLSTEESKKKLDLIIQELKREVKELNYEDALKSLDLVLDQLKNDDLPLSQIKDTYLKGNIYLSHCQKLLKVVEQEIDELSLDDL